MKPLALATSVAVTIVATPIPGPVQLLLLGIETVVALAVLAALLHDAKADVVELQVALGRRSLSHEATKAANRDLAAELLDAQGRLHDAETGAGLSDAQADALDDHWCTAVDASMLRAVGDVIEFPTQRTAGEGS